MTITKIDAAVQLKNRVSSIQLVIDGAGNPPVPGAQGQFALPAGWTQGATITGWVLTADQPGSAVIDIRRGTYAGFPTVASVTGSSPPTLVSAQKNEQLAVGGDWMPALNAGDVLEFVLLSVTSCTRLNLSLNITIP